MSKIHYKFLFVFYQKHAQKPFLGCANGSCMYFFTYFFKKISTITVKNIVIDPEPFKYFSQKITQVVKHNFIRKFFNIFVKFPQNFPVIFFEIASKNFKIAFFTEFVQKFLQKVFFTHKAVVTALLQDLREAALTSQEG